MSTRQTANSIDGSIANTLASISQMDITRKSSITPHMTKSPRPSIFAYCERSKLGGGSEAKQGCLKYDGDQIVAPIRLTMTEHGRQF